MHYPSHSNLWIFVAVVWRLNHSQDIFIVHRFLHLCMASFLAKNDIAMISLPDWVFNGQATADLIRNQDPTVPLHPREPIEIEGKGQMVSRTLCSFQSIPFRPLCLTYPRYTTTFLLDLDILFVLTANILDSNQSRSPYEVSICKPARIFLLQETNLGNLTQ